MPSQVSNVSALIVAVSLLLTACSEEDTMAPDFRTAVEHHLSTVTGRDLDAFNATLTSSDDLRVIFPNGAQLESTQAVSDFHQEWFADTDWVFEPEIVNLIEGDGQSTALVRYTYRDTPDGPPRQTWLVLVFQLEDGAWRLIHDQNTRISE